MPDHDETVVMFPMSFSDAEYLLRCLNHVTVFSKTDAERLLRIRDGLRDTLDAVLEARESRMVELR